MSKGRATALVIDDDFDLLSALQRAHSGQAPDWDLACLLDPRGALELIAPNAPEVAVVVLDLVMPEMEGLELLRRIRRVRPDLAVIVLTGIADSATHDAAIALGARFVLEKPQSFSKIREKIESLLPKRSDSANRAS